MDSGDDRLVELARSLRDACLEGTGVSSLAASLREQVLTLGGSLADGAQHTWVADEEPAPIPDHPLLAVCDGLLDGSLAPAAAAARLSTWLQPLPGSPTQRYQLGRLLGSGGMGQVHKGYDGELRRGLAVKVLRSGAKGDPRAARFIEEAQVTAQLEHPNIVPVHDLGTLHDGRPFFTMKRVRGRSLQELLEEGQLGTLQARLDLFRKVCDAIGFAHSKGVLHRDLKPGNVMVGRFGEVLVMDWGLAKVLGREYEEVDPEEEGPESSVISTDRAASRSDLSRDGRIAGTPAYMSPEQARGAVIDIGPQSDIYALGALLYELLVEAPAFTGTANDVLAAVKAGRFPPPRKVRSDVPRELEAVVLRAMALRPAERYLSAEDVRDDVTAWLEGRLVSAARYTFAGRVTKWAGRHRKAVRATSITAMLAALVLASATVIYVEGIEAARDLAVAEVVRAQAAERQATLRLAESHVALGDAALREGRVLAARTHYSAGRDGFVELKADPRPAELGLTEVDVLHPPPLVVIPADRPREVRLSPDAARALVRYDDHLELLSIPGGQVLARVEGTRLPFAFVDGEALYATVEGGRLRVRAVDGGEERLTLPVDGPGDVSLSGQIVSWTPPDGVRAPRIWRLDGTALDSRAPSSAGRWQVSDDGAVLVVEVASEGEGGIAELTAYDRRTGRGFAMPTMVMRSALSRDGRRLLVGSDHALTAADPNGDDTWELPTSPRTKVGFGPEGRHVWSTGFDGTVLLHDASDGAIVDSYPPVREGQVVDVAMHPELVLVATRDALTLYVGREHTGWRPWELGHAGASHGLAVGPDGRTALVVDGATLAAVDLASGRTLLRLPVAASGIRGVSWSPDGRSAAVAGRDGAVHVVDLVTARPVRSVALDGERALAVTWLPDGRHGLAADGDGLLYRMDLLEGRILHRVPAHDGAIWDLSVAAEAGLVLTAGYEQGQGHLRVWDAETLELVDEREQPPGKFHNDITADGQLAVAGSARGTLVLWDRRTDTVREIEADTGPTMGVALSPDGRAVLSTGYGRRLDLWDTATGSRLRSFAHHDAVGLAADFTPDGGTVAVTTADGHLVTWPVDLHDRLGRASESLASSTEATAAAAMGRGAAAWGAWDVALPYLQRAGTEPVLHARALLALGRFPEVPGVLEGADIAPEDRAWAAIAAAAGRRGEPAPAEPQEPHTPRKVSAGRR